MAARYVNGRETPEFSVWRAIIKRCHKPNTNGFERYGARGIAVCDRWRDSFDAFVDDMGVRPAGTSIDRFPNGAGNYEPGNCRWATPRQQAENRVSSSPITINGVTKFVREWAEISGLNAVTIKMRVRHGWPVERLLSPARPRSPDGTNLKRGTHACPHCSKTLTIYNLRRHIIKKHSDAAPFQPLERAA
jgi:hypothetical protein